MDVSRLEGPDTKNNAKILQAIDDYISRKKRKCDYRDRRWHPPAHTQGRADTCSSHVVSSLLEFLARKDRKVSRERAAAEALESRRAEPGPERERFDAASRLFLHQVAALISTEGGAMNPATRRLREEVARSGRAISDVLTVLSRYGVPPEAYWPYPEDDEGKSEEELKAAYESLPTAFTFRVAEDFKGAELICLDSDDLDDLDTEGLEDREEKPVDRRLEILMKATLLLYGLPLTAGVLGYPRRIADQDVTAVEPDAEWTTRRDEEGRLNKGLIPWLGKEPALGEGEEIATKETGGHAILIAGFDDDKVIHNPKDEQEVTRGAFLFQNSWGSEWGESGFGWLPYEYVRNGLVDDVWTLSRARLSNLGGVEEVEFLIGRFAEAGALDEKELPDLRRDIRSFITSG